MAFNSILGVDGYLHNGLLLAHYDWIQNLIKSKKPIPKNEFKRHPNYTDDDVKAFLIELRVPPCAPGTSNPWRLLSVEQFSRKEELVQSLIDIHRTPKEITEQANLDEDGCFSEVLEYIEQTNFVSMWQGAFMKWPDSFKMQNGADKYSWSSKYESSQCIRLPYDIVLLEAIKRAYRCPIIDARSQTNKQDSLNFFEIHFKRIQLEAEIDTSPPFHVDHALLAMVYDDEIVLLKPYKEYNLRDALRFSPDFLEDTECPVKQLFVIFQIFNSVRNLHQLGLTLGDVHLHDIKIDKQCMVSLKPHLEANLVPIVDPEIEITKLKVPKLCNCNVRGDTVFT